MRMKARLLGCSVLLFASAGAMAEPAGVSTFDTGLEGWTAFMSSSIADPTPTGELPLAWDPVGGFPGGAAAATVTSQFGSRGSGSCSARSCPALRIGIASAGRAAR